jgi:endonuclease-3
MKGTYILIISLKSKKRIKVGSLGYIDFDKGYYFYIGSALGKSMSLENRIARHLRKEKKIRWHIDYLLSDDDAEIIRVLTFRGRKECRIARKLSKTFIRIKKFGSSDCKCYSHLFYSKKLNFSLFHQQRVADNRHRAQGHGHTSYYRIQQETINGI